MINMVHPICEADLALVNGKIRITDGSSGYSQAVSPSRHYFCRGHPHRIPTSLAVFLISIFTGIRTGALGFEVVDDDYNFLFT